MTNAVNLASAAGTGFFRNKLINGDFRVAQRGTSFSGTATEYTVDRWRFLNAGVSASKSVSQQTATQGQTDFPPDTINFVNVSAGSVSGTGFASFDQPIEDVRTLAGQTVTVSFWAKGSVFGTVKVSIFNYFGGGGTATTSADTVTSSFNVTTSWARYSLTLAVPSFTGKTLGSGHANDIHFVLYADSTQFMGAASYTGTLSLANVQLEVGSVATPFERRPYGLEYELCRRYYRNFNIIGGFGAEPILVRGGAAGNRYYGAMAIDSRMRATPTLAIYSTAVHKPYIRYDSYSITNVQVNESYFGLEVVPSIDDGAANSPVVMFSNTNITLSAEL